MLSTSIGSCNFSCSHSRPTRREFATVVPPWAPLPFAARSPSLFKYDATSAAEAGRPSFGSPRSCTNKRKLSHARRAFASVAPSDPARRATVSLRIRLRSCGSGTCSTAASPPRSCVLTAVGSNSTSSSTSRSFLAASRSACDSKSLPMLLRFLRFVSDCGTSPSCNVTTGGRAASCWLPLPVLVVATWLGADSTVNFRLRALPRAGDAFLTRTTGSSSAGAVSRTHGSAAPLRTHGSAAPLGTTGAGASSGER